jgi:hypothetical protein
VSSIGANCACAWRISPGLMSSRKQAKSPHAISGVAADEHPILLTAWYGSQPKRPDGRLGAIRSRSSGETVQRSKIAAIPGDGIGTESGRRSLKSEGLRRARRRFRA